MPLTRKKARISYAETAAKDTADPPAICGDVDEDFEDDRKPAAAVKAKLSRKRKKTSSSKKQKTKKQEIKPLDTLPPEVLEQVMLFLSNPRTVLTLSMTSKSLRDAITPEIVIRSAIFHGGFSKERITNTIKAVEKYSIHMPSTFRLLRLATARSCERTGVQKCLQYDMTTSRSRSLVNHSETSKHGMHICFDCEKALVRYSDAGDPKVEKDGTRTYDLRGLAAAGYGSCMMLYSCLQCEAGTGDPFGSVVDFATYSREKRRFSQEAESGNLRREHEESSSSSSFRGPDVSDEYEQRRSQLLKIFQEADDHYEDFVKSKQDLQELRRQRRLEEADQRVARKLAKQQKILSMLEEALQDCPLKEAILKHDVKDGLVHFESPTLIYVQSLMDKPAPSTLSKKKVSELASSLSTLYSQFEQHNFIRGGHFGMPTSESSLERAIYSFCDEKEVAEELFSSKRVLSCGSSPDFEIMEKHLAEGSPFRAILSLMSASMIKDALLRFIKQTSHRQNHSTRIRILEMVWCKKVSVEARDGENAFNRALQEDTAASAAVLSKVWKRYVRICRNIREYYERPEVISWQQDNDENDEGRRTRRTKADVLRTFRGSYHWAYWYTDLVQGNFTSLLQKHKEIWSRGY